MAGLATDGGQFLHTLCMGTSTLRRIMPDRDSAVYWRRRFVALLIGLSVLALVAWALAGAIGGSPPAGSPAATRPLQSHSGTSPPAGKGSTGPGGKSAGQPASSGRPPLRACPNGDVVLSLFSSQAGYSIRQTPEFEIDVVSTASRSCSFDIGAGHVLLQISSGTSMVWTSADCAEGQASLVTKLRRGIPTVVPISWDGQRSSPGCPVPGTPAGAGTYSATATDGAHASQPLIFRIG